MVSYALDKDSDTPYAKEYTRQENLLSSIIQIVWKVISILSSILLLK